MALSSKIKDSLNAALASANLRLETRTREKQERLRLEHLLAKGYFDHPAFPVPSSFLTASGQVVFDNLTAHRARFESFRDVTANDVGYSFDNEYFSSPDAEVLYTLTRHFQPRRIIEVGSGYSTRIAHQAIKDGNLPTRLISIDPCPRREVVEICDEGIREPVESGNAKEKLRQLRAGDFLFIDSSHEVKTGNDVVYLFLNVLPQLESGVLVHVHDITLPWDYPYEWLMERHWAWTEQYLVQMMLGSGEMFEVIWPGHFLQRTRPDFETFFPFSARRIAYSLWLQKTK